MLRYPLLLLLLVLPWAVMAQVTDERAAAFVEAAGLEDEAEVFATQIAQMVHSQAAHLPPATRAPYRDIFIATLGSDNLSARLHEYVAQNADPQRLGAVHAWIDDPLVARMRAVERAAMNDPEAPLAVQIYAMSGRLGEEAVRPERVTLADRYIEVSGLGDAAIDLLLDLVVASTQMSGAILGEEVAAEETLRTATRPQIAAAFASSTRGQTLYAFRHATDEELEALIARAEDPAAQYFYKLSAEALSAAVVGAFVQGSQAFVQALNELHAEGEFDLEGWRAEVRQSVQGHDHDH
jgi:hypothetical protein